MEPIMLLIFSGLVVESVWETLKMVWQEGKLNVDRIGSLVVGIAVAFFWPVDLFAAVGQVFVYPFVGMLLTGVIISRGANFVHDILNTVKNIANIK